MNAGGDRPRAVVLGAGRIGCGLVAPRLLAAGYAVTLVSRNPQVARSIRQDGGYVVRSGTPGGLQTVRGVGVIGLDDADGVAAALTDAEVVAVAVAPADLPSVAETLWAPLAARSSVVDVLVVANDTAAPGTLRAAVVAAAQWPGLDERLERHGFVGALADRIVTRSCVTPAAALSFVAEPYQTLVVDWLALRNPDRLPAELTAVRDFEDAVRRKLWVFGAAHATAAYLGATRGHCYVHEAARDRDVRRALRAVVDEARRAVVIHEAAHRQTEGPSAPLPTAADVLRRLENPHLHDPLERVGRDPVRKLARGERLLGPASTLQAAGVRPVALELALAGGLLWYASRPPAVPGPARLLSEHCGLALDHGLGRAVLDRFLTMAPGLAATQRAGAQPRLLGPRTVLAAG